MEVLRQERAWHTRIVCVPVDLCGNESVHNSGVGRSITKDPVSFLAVTCCVEDYVVSYLSLLFIMLSQSSSVCLDNYSDRS